MLGDELGTEFCWPKEKKSKYRIAFYSISEVPFPKDTKNSQKNGKIWINKVSVWY